MDNATETGLCGYKSSKRPGFPEKLDWCSNRFNEGLRIKTLMTEEDGAQGMIEYIPGEYCWRPVDAVGLMFIHCIWVGFKKQYKQIGLGSQLLEVCEKDARESGKAGVAVVTRKTSFMAGSGLFLKHGYRVIESASPDFNLLAKPFSENWTPPKFRDSIHNPAPDYSDGLVILRAFQCPYTVKNVDEICQVAKDDFSITPKLITFQSHTEAQTSPCPFGTFCILYNGEVIAQHPISKTRFTNIMNKLVQA